MNYKPLSIFMDRFVPRHVKLTYPGFIKFFETYLEYLDSIQTVDGKEVPMPYKQASELLDQIDYDEMYQEIIDFWFEEIDKSKWWIKDESFDELIRVRFSNIYAQAIKGELYSWRKNGLGMLAEIIVLDQFSRNMYRDKPESFSQDLTALTLAQTAISYGVDLELEQEKRSFLYMPFMHSESLLIHNQAVKLFTGLGQTSSLTFEKKHKVIIEKFGRYPHRNEILGRISSKEEKKFLQQPNSRF